MFGPHFRDTLREPGGGLGPKHINDYYPIEHLPLFSIYRDRQGRQLKNLKAGDLSILGYKWLQRSVAFHLFISIFHSLLTLESFRLLSVSDFPHEHCNPRNVKDNLFFYLAFYENIKSWAKGSHKVNIQNAFHFKNGIDSTKSLESVRFSCRQ